jgi:hypothetical protein
VELGFDPGTLIAAPYDFRLSPRGLDQRDNFFKRLKVRQPRTAPASALGSSLPRIRTGTAPGLG